MKAVLLTITFAYSDYELNIIKKHVLVINGKNILRMQYSAKYGTIDQIDCFYVIFFKLPNPCQILNG